jgi:hypothetical protein
MPGLTATKHGVVFNREGDLIRITNTNDFAVSVQFFEKGTDNSISDFVNLDAKDTDAVKVNEGPVDCDISFDEVSLDELGGGTTDEPLVTERIDKSVDASVEGDEQHTG